MQVPQLRVFVTAAHLRNFTRTAQALGRTQSAVSYSIRALENYLRVPLFNRSPGGAVTLTSAGIFLLPYAQRVVNAADELRNTEYPTPTPAQETTETPGD